MTPAPTLKTLCRCGKMHNEPGECALPSNVVKAIRYKDWEFAIAHDESYLQVRFVSSEGSLQRGRKWRLSPYMTRSEVVQTAFLAVLQAEEHEAREAFLYKGVHIYGPHLNADRLVTLIHQGGAFQERPKVYPNA